MNLLIVVLTFVILAAVLAWYLISRDRGSKEPVEALWLVTGLGVLAAILAGIVEGLLIPSHFVTNPSSGTSHQLLAVAMLIGLIEESAKFIPAAIYLYHKSYFNEHTDGIIYFALVGLGFGVPENILYALSFGAKAGLTRIIMTPIFHASTTALVGYFLIRGKLSHRRPLILASAALLVAVLIHGLYDFGLMVTGRIPAFALLSLLITGSLTVSLFVLYQKATQQDQSIGASAIGRNDFCRHCGTANTNHNLYCSHCGKHA